MNRRQFVMRAALTGAALYAGVARPAGLALRVRRSINDMTAADPFFATYSRAVTLMRALPAGDLRSWRNQSLMHLKFCRHGPQDFLHWHRHYLVNFESICAKLTGDPNFALPYWDWTRDSGRLPAPFFDLPALNVVQLGDTANDSSPNWAGGRVVRTIGSRALSKTSGLLDAPLLGGEFTPVKIAGLLALPQFSLFYSRLEGSPHGNAHVIVGGDTGHMRDGMSPLDPIFWLHHCNVDRLWAEWHAAGNSSPGLGITYTGQFVDGNGSPVTPRSDDALQTANFNYTYDTVPSGPAPSPPAGLTVLGAAPSSSGAEPANVREPQKIGGLTGKRSAVATQVVEFVVPTVNLRNTLSQTRMYRALSLKGEPLLARQDTRLLATLKNVVAPDTDVPYVVNVFVNCAYASATTPYTDKHFAGTFSFFGVGAKTPRTVIVDLTDATKTLGPDGIADAQISIKAVPVPIDDTNPFKGEVTFDEIELLRV